jgi:hypothetical protein
MTRGYQTEAIIYSPEKYSKSCIKSTTKVVDVCYNPAHFPGECPSHEHWPTRRASSIHSVERCPAQNFERQTTLDSQARDRSLIDRFIDAIFASMVVISISGLLYVFSH